MLFCFAFAIIYEILYIDASVLPTSGHGVTRIRGTNRVFEKTPKREAPEGGPKIDAIECIDKRIHGTVKPAQPRQSAGDFAFDEIMW